MRNPLFVFAALALVLLTGCETMKGVGRDVKTTGEVITDSSRQIQKSL
jgi:predicted small secreted protein